MQRYSSTYTKIRPMPRVVPEVRYGVSGEYPAHEGRNDTRPDASIGGMATGMFFTLFVILIDPLYFDLMY